MTTAILLIGYGGPTRPEEILPYLEGIAHGRGVPRERLERVAAQYHRVGGRSPFNELTERQAAALRRQLADLGSPLPVYVGMRSWHPILAETLAQMRDDGIDEAIGIVLAPQRSDESWERYHRAVDAARAEVPDAPSVAYADPWHTHDGFLDAAAEHVRAATRFDNWPSDVPLIGTAHSIPTRLADESRYREEIAETTAGIADRVGAARWMVAYQSRSGDPRTPWLEPDISDVLTDLAGEGVREVVVTPVGFVCDNVEVLFDLGIQARETAGRFGLRFTRPEAVGDHPAFVAMLAELALAAFSRRSTPALLRPIHSGR
jgi:ferrochelatase